LEASANALAELELASARATLITLLALACILDWTLTRLADIWLLKDELAWAMRLLASWLAWEMALSAEDCVRAIAELTETTLPLAA
jgi:hypothetical protein